MAADEHETGEPDSSEWDAVTLAADEHEADTPVRVRPPRGALVRGQQLGRYFVMDRLGAGGMGVVYAAFDPRLDRKVALKVLHGSSDLRDGGEARARLLREAQALAKLSHPNVVAVHDVGEVDGRVFVAMEFVAGRTLRDWLDVGEAGARPGWAEVKDVFVAAARGLAAAHEAGVIHRDFKPDNVLLSTDGRVRVADFGIAVAPQREGASESVIATLGDEFDSQSEAPDAATRTGVAMGTPAYMSPEQWSGVAVSAKSDQFSFCVAFYEALYGRRPFEGKTLAELSAATLAGRMRASASDKVPSWLDRVVRRGLSPRPSDRYADMLELIADLERDPMATRRRILLLTTVSLAFVAAIIGGRALAPQGEDCARSSEGFDSVWNDDRASRLRSAFATTGSPFADTAAGSVIDTLDGHAARWRELSIDTCERFFVRREDSDRLHDLRRACLERARSETDALVELLLDADGELVGEAIVAVHSLADPSRCAALTASGPVVLPPEASVEAEVESVRRTLDEARARIHAGRYAAALERAEAGASAARDIGYAPLIGASELVLGEARFWAGDYEGAASALHVAARTAAGEGDLETEARAFLWLVWVVGYAGRELTAGLELAHAAEAAILRAGDDPALRADLLDYRGMLLVERGELDLAGPLLEQALTLREEIHGTSDHRVIWSLNNLSVLAAARGDFAAAIALQERALPMRLGLHGPGHPDLGFGHKNLGRYHHAAGNLDEAERHDREAVAIFAAGFGPRHPQLAEAKWQLAQVLRDERAIRDALVAYDDAIATARAAEHPRTPDIERERAALSSAPEGAAQ